MLWGWFTLPVDRGVPHLALSYHLGLTLKRGFLSQLPCGIGDPQFTDGETEVQCLHNLHKRVQLERAVQPG